MAAGLTKERRVHDLRHTCASWMIQAGVPLPVTQQHLGTSPTRSERTCAGRIRIVSATGCRTSDPLAEPLGRSGEPANSVVLHRPISALYIAGALRNSTAQEEP